MRRIAVLIAAIAMAMMGLTAATADAAENNPTNAEAAPIENCNHWSGTGGVVKAKYVQVLGNGANVGSAQLCVQGSYYWAYVVFYAKMSTGNWGQAYLQRFHGGQVIDQWSCDTAPVTAPNGETATSNRVKLSAGPRRSTVADPTIPFAHSVTSTTETTRTSAFRTPGE
jgi:hypothetical protein